MEPVWNKYLEFECNVGDLQSMQKVELIYLYRTQYMEQVENRRIQKILHKSDDLDDNNKKIETRSSQKTIS